MMLQSKCFACWLLLTGANAFFVSNSRSVESSQLFQSAATATQTDLGYANVDMNKYNLLLDEIAQEWTANVVAESSMREAGVYLGAKTKKEIMVDTVQVELPRRVGEGMGMLLLEIAGGREDGLGITVINGLVEGGCADGSEVVLGDSIAAISVRKSLQTQSGGGLSDTEVVDSVSLECFGYDKTIDVLGSLPPAESNDEVLVLTLKRLRRKPKVSIKLQYPPIQNEPDTMIELFAGENLRRAMLTRGVKLNDPLSARFDSGGMGDCGADGTCATCVVGVLKGDELLSPKGQQEEQILVKNPRWRMACKTIVGYGQQEGEMTIRVNPRQWDN